MTQEFSAKEEPSQTTLLVESIIGNLSRSTIKTNWSEEAIEVLVSGIIPAVDRMRSLYDGKWNSTRWLDVEDRLKQDNQDWEELYGQLGTLGISRERANTRATSILKSAFKALANKCNSITDLEQLKREQAHTLAANFVGAGRGKHSKLIMMSGESIFHG